MELNLALDGARFAERAPEAGGDDAEVALVRAAQRDPREFAALYELYFQRVFGYVRVRIADRASCEDVTSQIFARALDKLASFRGRGSFAAWLFRIAQNAVRDEQRRGRRVVAVPAEALDASLGAEVPPEAHAIARERRAHLRAALAELEHDKQHVIALRYGAGLNYEEIGGLLGIRAGTARVRLHRALGDLQGRYDDER